MRISGHVPFPETMGEFSVVQQRFGFKPFTACGQHIADDDHRLAVNARLAYPFGQISQSALNDMFIIP
jgi:hypothetical protein